VTLAAGSRLGPYEILGQIGAGGMGEVYRARDARLDREVALKVLPAELSKPDSLRRFEREARAASALNHPNIVVVYDVGRAGEVSYIAMEMVEGRPLSELVAFEPLPLRRVLSLATQLAEGLARAHAAGIVHRDLKPENVMVTADGFVKILDFGLAKLVGSDAPLTTEHTAALEAPLTQADMVMGTVGYMSPEQAAGRSVDYPSDQFALGAIVYEMLTGRRAFRGASAAETMTAVIREEPEPLASLRPETPAPLSWIIERCLAKEATERYESTRDLARDLATVRDRASSAGTTGLMGAPSRPPRGKWVPWAIAAAGLLAAVLFAVTRLGEKPAPPRSIRFVIPPPEKGLMESGFAEFHNVAVSPEGNRIAFVASVEGRSRIWVRALDALEAAPLPGTEDPSSPFWSPDGKSLGFFADQKLKTIPAAGGPPQTVCAAAVRSNGAWGAGIIVFSQNFTAKDGLYAVADSGGEPRQLVSESKRVLWARWPRFLPDGRHFLFMARDDAGRYLAAGEIGSSRIQRLTPLSSRFELSSGYLFSVKEGVLVARTFDVSSLRLGAETIPVAERIPLFEPSGWAPFSVVGNVVAYQARSADAPLRWLDRKGATASTAGPPGQYGSLRLSPDGRKVVVEKYDPGTGLGDLWILDLSRDVLTRFTADPGLESWPAWSPDGEAIAFVTHGVSQPELRLKRLGDSTPGEVLLREGFPVFIDWSRDGRLLAFTEQTGKFSIGVIPLSGDRKPSPLRKTQFNDGGAVFSPDGRWVAFLSDESKAPQAYVVSASGSGPTRQVSSKPAGIVQPLRWRADGRELFYGAADGELMAVPVRVEAGRFESGTPVPLFRVATQGNSSYDVSADGERFLVSEGRAIDDRPVTVIAHWTPRKGPQ
jgi:eukaryotic-like serine/threonine-protein kinase